MISQLEPPALERGLGSLPGGGGSGRSRPPRGRPGLDQLTSVEGFCVEWQLLESPPGRLETGVTPRAVGGRTA